MTHTLVHWLPVAALAAPVLFAAPLPAAPPRLRNLLWVAGAAVTLALAIAQAALVAGGAVLTALGGELRVDGLAAVMSLLITFVGFACVVYGTGYLPGGHARAPERTAALERGLPRFQALFLVLESTLLWTATTDNLVFLWVALEATTLASALLVSFFGDARALEAGWKYLLLLTVGITGAFFGCVLLYAAAAPHLGSESALLISNLRQVVDQVPVHMALIAALLLLIGFGTKAGLAPFHPWVADAHAEAPAVMSAFLSGVIIKAPFIGILRIWSVFAPHHPVLNDLLLALGAFTLVVGGFLALGQDDLKRLHASSSVSQVGYVAVALGTGHPFGWYAAVFFILAHGLAKGLLFLVTGAVQTGTHGRRDMTALGGLGRRMPVTVLCATAGALSLAGMPPFGGFLAKFQVALATAHARTWTVMAIAVAASLLTMAYMIGMLRRVFRGAPRDGLALAEVREAPLAMTAAMVLLALATLALGLAPGLIDPLLALVETP